MIVDLTRANPGTEQNVLDRARASFPEVDPDTFVVVCHDDQLVSLRTGEQQTAIGRTTHYRTIAATVNDLIQQVLSGSADALVSVITIHRAIFDMVEAYLPDAKVRVNVRSYSTLRAADNKTNVSAWPADAMPLDHAIVIMHDTLHAQGATSRDHGVRQSELRAFMGSRDKRFRKPYTLGTAAGVLATLVKAAQARGVVDLDPDPSNPRVWLTEEASKQPPRLATTKESRSQRFINIWRAEGLGPFASIRTDLYDALEQVVADGRASGALITAGHLTKKAVDLARARLHASDRSEDYPWTAVRDFLNTLLSRQPVLLDQSDDLIVLTWQALSRSIAGFAPDWRLNLEGELVIALLAAGAELTLTDAPLLAGAMFFSRDDNALDRTNEIIVHLLNSRRVAESSTPQRHLVLRGARPKGEALPVEPPEDRTG